MFYQNKISIKLLHDNVLMISGKVFLCDFNTMKISKSSVFATYQDFVFVSVNQETN